MGRPSDYTDEKAQEIINRIASGETLTAICKDKHLPHCATVLRWVNRDGEEYQLFREDYAHACSIRADNGFEQIGDIEQRLLSGEIEPNVARVAIDSIKWRIGKMKGKYSDNKHILEHQGKDGGPIEFTDTERAAKLASILEQARRQRETQSG